MLLDRLVVAAATDDREAGILFGAGADAVILESTIGLRGVRAVVKAVSCPVMVTLDADDKEYRSFTRAGADALVFNFRDPRVASAGAIAQLSEQRRNVSDGT
jgi:2-methylisocitrate lyase-like PEP mutase family enzyme